MRLFALWKVQECKRTPELQDKLCQLQNQKQIVDREHQDLKAKLVMSKGELNHWESQLQTYVLGNLPLRTNIQSLYSSNQTLKNEIQKIYNGNIDDFQRLEIETRNVRTVNNNLEAQINKLYQYLLDRTSENEALSSEIQDIKSKIKVLQNHLRNKYSLTSSTRNVPRNPTQSHLYQEQENSDDKNLQLPRKKGKFLEYNENYLKNNSENECTICLEKLNESASNGYIQVTPCGHRFHAVCIQDLFDRGNSVCPLCRKPINANSLRLQTDWDNTKPLFSCFHVNFN